MAASAAVLLVTSCSTGRVSAGPLQLEVPDGWQVTAREGDNLQIANGTAGGATASRPGTAGAVFDVYVNTQTTPEEFLEGLEKRNVGASVERLTVGGYPATILSYAGPAVAGRQEAVFVPAWRVQIVYRAAFANDDAAFFAGRTAFRRAVASIRFSGSPPRPTGRRRAASGAWVSRSR